MKAALSMIVLFLATALIAAKDEQPFREVNIDPAFRQYLLANPVLMETTGVKIIKLPDDTYLILSVASTVLKNDSAEERLRAETVCPIKAMRNVVAATEGVQIASVQKSEDSIVVIIDRGERKVKSVAAYLETTEARVQGLAKGMLVVGRWKSKDGKVYSLAIGSVCDKKGNVVPAK
jgi:hypothetical protein